MYIRDPIYGNIEVSDTELKIIEDEHMQRLRYIRQTGFAYLVYPGANHTRFEHSIGTMQATKELAENIYSKDDLFTYMGLLHDIGHGPFSHQSEPIIEKYLKKTHEKLGMDIVLRSGIKDIILDSGVSLKKILECFTDKDGHNIISGTLGSDRIDYLLRDSYYTGVAYGIVDFPRIKSKITKYKNKIAIYEQGVSAAESLLLARYFMFENVYMHHAQLIAAKMFTKAAEAAIEEGELEPKLFASMKDEEAMMALSHTKSAAELVHKIQDRKLFKRVYNNAIGDADAPSIKELESALSRKGLGANDYIIETYSMKLPGGDIDVVDRNNAYIGKLGSISELVGTLVGKLGSKKMLLIAVDHNFIEKASSAIKPILAHNA